MKAVMVFLLLATHKLCRLRLLYHPLYLDPIPYSIANGICSTPAKVVACLAWTWACKASGKRGVGS
jgi:hypothetical protein